MKLVKITWPGLTVIALLVAMLWGCVLSERTIRYQARRDTYRALRQIRYLKMQRVMEPASAPVAVPSPIRQRSIAG